MVLGGGGTRSSLHASASSETMAIMTASSRMEVTAYNVLSGRMLIVYSSDYSNLRQWAGCKDIVGLSVGGLSVGRWCDRLARNAGKDRGGWRRSLARTQPYCGEELDGASGGE